MMRSGGSSEKSPKGTWKNSQIDGWLLSKYISIMGKLMLYGDPDVMSFTIVILHSTFLLLSVYRFCVS